MSAFADLRAACTRAEALLAETARRRQSEPAAAPDAARLDAARLELERAAAACGPLPAGLARRVQQLRARFVLQARHAPAEALDGLYDAVRAGTLGGDPRVGRAGMSGAFLDAPGALARWRTAALAACVLLVVGSVVLSRAEVRFEDPAVPRPLHDPRDELLRRAPSDETAMAPDAARRMPEGASFVPLGPSGGRITPIESAPRFGGRARDEAATPFVLFHVGPGNTTRVQIEEGALLDALGQRLRVRVLPPPSAQDERESN